MKRKLLYSSAVIPALLASGAMGQVVSFHDGANGQLTFPGVGYNELFAGQGAYSDPGNDIWNGFGYDAGYASTYFYSGDFNSGGDFPQQYGNPGNPYAAYNKGSAWVSSTGASLFNFDGSPTNSGNATSGGVFTPITLLVGGYSGDSGLGNVGSALLPDGTPAFLLGETAVKNGNSPNEVFTLQNVPAGTYGLYLYAANYDNNRGTTFAVSSGTAHNGISSTLNGQNGSPAPSFVEGQNYVIFENVSPDGSGNITITGSPNAADGTGNSNLGGETDVNGFQLVFNPPPTAQGLTPAQNVYAGGTASFSFTPVFASGASFRWQSIIGGVTNVLADGANIVGSGTTNLTLSSISGGSAGLYQCVITTAIATNASPEAPLTLLTSTATTALQTGDTPSAIGYILQPGDVLADANNNNGGVLNSVPPPFVMGTGNIEDGKLNQYVNLGGSGSVAPFSGPVSVTVTPNIGASVVTGLRFFASGTHPEDDPADYLLTGSIDGGNTFTPIAGGLLSIPDARNAAGGPIDVSGDVLQEIDFANTAAYTMYQLTITNVKNDAIASNGVQIAEVQFLGSLPAVQPGIVTQPNSDQHLLAGATFDPAVAANGAGPISYTWYFGATPITGQTNATLIVTNVQSGSGGNYYCAVSNSYGTTNSVTVGLSIVTPTAYETALLALNPMAYWPLDETGGLTAYDTAGGFNGTYVGGVTLNQPGVPSQGFGSGSISATFDGSSGYTDIPEGPFNISGAISVAVWANITAHGNFAGLMGHGDSSWRTSNNGGGQPGASDGGAGDVTGPNSIIDGNWHLIVYSYNGVLNTMNNQNLYVDGVLVSSGEVNNAPSGNNLDVWIGGAPDYDTGRLLPASLAHAAIFNYGLTSNQVQTLYFASAPTPVATIPATVSVNLGGSVTIPSTVVGKPPFDYQWYDSLSGVTTPITGATGDSLTLTNVQAGQINDNYYLVVSNTFGAFTSAVVTLNIQSGAPVLQADISPLLVEVPVGVSVTYSASATGTEPFSYQWSTGSGAISGATDSSYTFNALPGSTSYSVVISNSLGSIPSSTAVVIGLTNPSPVVTFNSDGTGWTFNQGSGWPGAVNHPGISNNLLTLTDGTNGEVCSAFFDTPQYIGGFIASFTYQDVGGGGADGTTFCIENSTNTATGIGLNAVGGGGGELGFAGVLPSAAFELNIYSGDHGGQGILFATGGSTPNSDPTVGNFINPAPVAVDSGDPLTVDLYYANGVLTLAMTDTTSAEKYNTTFNVPDLAAAVGGPSAFVGFTAATGGVNSTQTVNDFEFSYTTPPILSVAQGASGTVIVSWPISVSSLFQLQSSASISGPWAAVTGSATVVGLENQFTVTTGATPGFYRLTLQ